RASGAPHRRSEWGGLQLAHHPQRAAQAGNAMNDRPKNAPSPALAEERRDVAASAAGRDRAGAPPREWRTDPGFETRAIHAGTPPDPTTGARITPIYHTIGYVFDDVDHAASLFDLSTFGYIYSRLSNPTVSALE